MLKVIINAGEYATHQDLDLLNKSIANSTEKIAAINVVEDCMYIFTENYLLNK